MVRPHNPKVVPTDPLALLTAPILPTFIHLHHPHHPTTSLPTFPTDDSRTVHIDLVEHNTARLLYSGILHRIRTRLGKGRYNHGNYSSNGIDEQGQGESLSWDDLSRGLRSLIGPDAGRTRGKGKAKAKEHARVNGDGHANGTDENDAPAWGLSMASYQVEREGKVTWIICLTHAERLRAVLGHQWAVITRIAELTGLDICLITASQQPWDHLRPFAADAPEPIHIYLPAPGRTELAEGLALDSTTRPNDMIDGKRDVEDEDGNGISIPPSSNTAHRHPLWPHFLNLLLASFDHLVPSSSGLSFLAEPLWLIYTATLPAHAEQYLISSRSDATAVAPPLEVTVKLLTDLKYTVAPALTAASESLLTNQVGRSSFLSSLLPTSGALGTSTPRHGINNPSLSSPSSKRIIPSPPTLDLPYISQFILISAYLSSQNPPRTDLRLFGRAVGADGKRKKGGGTRRAGYGRVKVGKVPQRLMGPKPFGLDRMWAVFGALYAENGRRPGDLEVDYGEEWDDSDSDSSNERSSDDDNDDGEEGLRSNGKRKGTGNGNGRTPTKPLDSAVERQKARVERKRKRETDRGERWEEYVEGISMSTTTWGLIPDLEAQGLLRRISPPDRLDAVTLRCEIGYEATVHLAREVGITLDDYLYEAQS